jgi:uncharacterized protein involved in outer membrane biogenesis
VARIRTYGKWIAAVVILLLLAQLGLPFVMQTRRMRAYLLAHLERSFGRPVQARGFSMQILPFPRVDMEGVSIEEDPSFGHEYFLRADRMTASVRWLGLLRGHFDFGTISLSRPSLILVRNEQGRWNLEGWLPPAAQRAAVSGGVAYGPQRPADAGNHLQKIEFDEGRINFKTGDEKRPFAFTEVSGSVEQVAPGRWQLHLEAVPWRSGVALQSTGTLQVRGEVAGTSARLQPAEIQVHWGKVSIADLFRMMTGNDSGVRGEFALDGTASVGKPDAGEQRNPGAWKFSAHARATRLHRWDLTERDDNPGVSLNLKGVWDVLAGEARAGSVTLDLPQSHFEGAAALKTAGMSEWSLRVENAGVQAQDLLAWYRAFQPDVAESVAAKQFFKARFALRGMPLFWEDAQISSDGGEIRLPGFAKPLRIGAVQGGARSNVFELRPVQLTLPAATKDTLVKAEKAAAKGASISSSAGQFELRFRDDFAAGKGSLHFSGKLEDAADFFKAAAAFGKELNHGWELTGGSSGFVARDWDHGVANGRWNGSLTFARAQLQVAGLNLPVRVDDGRVEWKNGQRNASITRAEAFGAAWSGTINDAPSSDDSADKDWKFQLHADHLDATDLDLWFGPRARPNWLQRLLPSLLGKSDSGAKPSELLRRISAEGDFTADSLTIEKVKLGHASAHVAFHDLHLDVKDASADWAGGTTRGSVSAVFSLPPQYEISVDLDRANLAEFPWSPKWVERWSGTASGKLRLTTSGIGREELLDHLFGGGEVRLKTVELHGWDVPASLDGGTMHTGSSRWATGEGEFTIKEHALRFDSLTLENPHAKVHVNGNFGFQQNLDLTFAAAADEKYAGKSAAAPRTFQLTGPLEAPVAHVQVAPVTQAKKQE